mgnify:CR=1 FL=1
MGSCVVSAAEANLDYIAVKRCNNPVGPVTECGQSHKESYPNRRSEDLYGLLLRGVDLLDVAALAELVELPEHRRCALWCESCCCGGYVCYSVGYLGCICLLGSHGLCCSYCCYNSGCCHCCYSLCKACIESHCFMYLLKEFGLSPG